VITIGTVAAVAGIVFAAAVLQRALGFGFALLAVPLLAFVVPTKSAVIIIFLNGTVTCAWMARRLRRHIEWVTARRLGVAAIVGAPIGVVILSVISANALRLVLGITTCLAAVWIIVTSRFTSSDPVVPDRWTTFALGFASGVINTSLATNGPPLVYELRRRGFHGDRFRATISAVFLLSNVIGLPLLALAGLITSFDVVLAASSVLPCVAGIIVGSWMGARMGQSHFGWAVDFLLLATGLLTISKVVS
jgi:uncharacterized membrane protein YfcA